VGRNDGLDVVGLDVEGATVGDMVGELDGDLDGTVALL
jgi:hypothetical protein